MTLHSCAHVVVPVLLSSEGPGISGEAFGRGQPVQLLSHRFGVSRAAVRNAEGDLSDLFLGDLTGLVSGMKELDEVLGVHAVFVASGLGKFHSACEKNV